MEIGIGLVGGLVVGAIIGYFIVNGMLGKKRQAMIEEMNAKADEEIEKAQRTAKSIVEKAEAKNEGIKQKKIKEAKDRFN
jgi:ribonuclease Y